MEKNPLSTVHVLEHLSTGTVAAADIHIYCMLMDGWMIFLKIKGLSLWKKPKHFAHILISNVHL